MGERMLDAATRRRASSRFLPCSLVEMESGMRGTAMEGRKEEGKGRGDLIQLNTIIVIARLLVLQRN